MRGEEVRCNVQKCCWGITPAHAGRRQPGVEKHRPGWDHPRACGEKTSIDRRCSSFTGSPPRMRGEVFPASMSCAGRGITPAHAGRRIKHYPYTGLQEDHPRACGEKTVCRACEQQRRGSPPRMRGEAFDGIKKAAEDRITPAHAGRRKSCNGRVVSIEDHPRACGEKPQPKPPPLELEGSPPRMRGEEYLVSPDVAKPRITPAHAGRS